MKGRVERARAKAGLGASRGLRGVARIVSLITSIVVGLIVVGIILVLLEASGTTPSSTGSWAPATT
jgi:hypothetical protein